MSVAPDSSVGLRVGRSIVGLAAAGAAFVALAPPVASADPEDCNETLTAYDPHDLVLDTDVLLDLSTLVEVENLVDGCTDNIDEALDAEFDDLEPPDGVSSDDLIDEARWKIEDAIDLGCSLAGCEDDL